jgi:hypothetical protein
LVLLPSGRVQHGGYSKVDVGRVGQTTSAVEAKEYYEEHQEWGKLRVHGAVDASHSKLHSEEFPLGPRAPARGLQEEHRESFVLPHQ